MNKTAGIFMKAGVIYALIGFALGVVMGASGDFAMRSVHAHLALLGWATMAIYAFYYQLVPVASTGVVSKVHFLLANLGLIILSIGVAILATGNGAGAPGAAAGSIITLLSMLLFVYIVFKTGSAGYERG